MRNKTVFHLLVVTIFGYFFLPGSVFAVWYNPSTWFGSGETNNNGSNQQLIERISELEKKVNEQGSQPSQIVSSSTVVRASTDLQSKIDELSQENISLQTKLSNFQNQLKNAQNNYATCQASLASMASANSPASNPSNSLPSSNSSSIQSDVITPVQLDKPYDYINYVKVIIADYVKNPKSYLGWGTEIMVGQVDDFLAAGDRGVTNNYIEVTDISKGANVIPDKMMVLIQDDNDYSKIVYSLKKEDIVDVWGIGSPSQQFRSIGSSDSSSSYEPVITLQRIDKCGLGTFGCQYGNTISVFSKGI